ncbi:MAG: hypothetical protein EXR69_00690 [Myxococcales bacterium]|nr:hypothetical protein [Myxococcales bacterium]
MSCSGHALPLAFLVGLGACNSTDSICFSDPFGDMCRYEKFKDEMPVASSDALAVIVAMNDPVVRTAAVELWLKRNPKVPPAEGVKLCETLLEGEKQNCSRKVNSPHLHRP